MKKNSYYFILLPAVVLLLFFLFLPLVESIFPTFFKENHLNLSSYLTFFKDSYNQAVILRTLRIALIVTLFCVVLGLPTSFYIAQTSKKYRGLLLSLTLFPLLTNSVIRSFAWINILGKEGVINQGLLKLHIVSQPISFLYTEFAIIIGSIYLFLPTMIITLVGVLETIDLEILEAAKSLGATPFKTFYKILLPLAIPGVIVGSTLVFTGTLTAYTTPQLLGGNQKMLLATLLYQKASTLGDWQSASVIAFVMIVLTLLVMYGFRLIEKMMDGRTKNA